MLINETAAQSGMSTKSQVLGSISYDQISEVTNVSVDVSSEVLSNVCNESSNGKILGNFQRLRRKSIQWIIKKRQSIHWLDKLFPDKIKVDKEADNEDVISREESDLRIIWFLKLMAIFLSLLILGLILTIIILLIPHQPTVIQPKIPKKDIFYRYFPIAHLAIIFADGSVYDYSLEPHVSPSIGWFLKLPKKSQYLGYSDPKGILYFLDGQLVSPIVRYHEAINEQGHDTISMELDSDHKYSLQNDAQKIFRCSAEVGDKFWLLGSSPFSSLDLHASGMLANTAVWYKKKQKVRFGPNLPSLLGAHEIGEFNHFCTLGINSTHLMIFGITKITDEHDFNKVALIDFNKQKWTFWTPIPLDEYEGITNCHASLEIDKSGSLKIWLMAEKYSEIIDQIPNSYLEVLTHNFGFGNGWEFVSTYDTGGNILMGGFLYKRILYSVVFNGLILEFHLEEEIWEETKMASNQSVMSIIPFTK